VELGSVLNWPSRAPEPGICSLEFTLILAGLCGRNASLEFTADLATALIALSL
jgi:hypothetical protein